MAHLLTELSVDRRPTQSATGTRKQNDLTGAPYDVADSKNSILLVGGWRRASQPDGLLHCRFLGQSFGCRWAHYVRPAFEPAENSEKKASKC